MIVDNNEKLEAGLTYRLNFTVKAPLISVKPFDTLRQELAEKIKYEFVTSGFTQVSTYIYPNEIHAIGVYNPSFYIPPTQSNNTGPGSIVYLSNNNNLKVLPIVLVGVIVAAVASLILAFSFSVTGKTVEKFTNPKINYIWLASGLLVFILIFIMVRRK
jgi:hypothetical protein